MPSGVSTQVATLNPADLAIRWERGGPEAAAPPGAARAGQLSERLRRALGPPAAVQGTLHGHCSATTLEMRRSL